MTPPIPSLQEEGEGSVKVPTVREQFEVWSRKEGMLLRRVINGHGYMDVDTHGAWSGWNGALQAIAARSGWQAIETAPRAGGPFLVYRPLAEVTHDPVISLVHGLPSDRGCWESTVPEGMDGTNFTSGYCKATHWMPLPAAPCEVKESK